MVHKITIGADHKWSNYETIKNQSYIFDHPTDRDNHWYGRGMVDDSDG
jgi:hypothetical protein